MEFILVMGSKDGKHEWFGEWKGLSNFLKQSEFIQDHSMYLIFWGPTGCPIGVTINIIEKGGVINRDKSRLVVLKNQYHPMVREEKLKVEGGAKQKWRRFQQ